MFIAVIRNTTCTDRIMNVVTYDRQPEIFHMPLLSLPAGLRLYQAHQKSFLDNDMIISPQCHVYFWNISLIHPKKGLKTL